MTKYLKFIFSQKYNFFKFYDQSKIKLVEWLESFKNVKTVGLVDYVSSINNNYYFIFIAKITVKNTDQLINCINTMWADYKTDLINNWSLNIEQAKGEKK